MRNTLFVKRSVSLAPVVAALVGCAILSVDAAGQGLLERLEQRLGEALDQRPARESELTPRQTDASTRRDRPGYLGLVGDDRGEQGNGVRVVSVKENGPAADAGILRDDLIVAIYDKPIRSLSDMADALRDARAGQRVSVDLLRGSERQTRFVALGVAGESDTPPALNAMQDPQPGQASGGGQQPRLGVHLGAVSSNLRRLLALDAQGGAVIQRVDPNTPAAKAELPVGGIILGLDGSAVGGPDDVVNAMAGKRFGDTVNLVVHDGRQRRQYTVRLDENAVAEGLPAPATSDGRRTAASPPTDAGSGPEAGLGPGARTGLGIARSAIDLLESRLDQGDRGAAGSAPVESAPRGRGAASAREQMLQNQIDELRSQLESLRSRVQKLEAQANEGGR